MTMVVMLMMVVMVMMTMVLMLTMVVMKLNPPEKGLSAKGEIGQSHN